MSSGHPGLRPHADVRDAACVRLRRSASRSAAVRVLPACARKEACLVQPWELLRRDVARLPVPCCHGHPVHRRCRGVAGIAKAVHPDAARARYRGDPAARCSDDTVEALHQPGACLAAHLDVIGPARNQALPDVPDSVAKLKVRQLHAESLARPPQDVLPQARFPVLLQAAGACQDAARTQRARRRDVQQ